MRVPVGCTSWELAGVGGRECSRPPRADPQIRWVSSSRLVPPESSALSGGISGRHTEVAGVQCATARRSAGRPRPQSRHGNTAMLQSAAWSLGLAQTVTRCHAGLGESAGGQGGVDTNLRLCDGRCPSLQNAALEQDQEQSKTETRKSTTPDSCRNRGGEVECVTHLPDSLRSELAD